MVRCQNLATQNERGVAQRSRSPACDSGASARAARVALHLRATDGDLAPTFATRNRATVFCAANAAP